MNPESLLDQLKDVHAPEAIGWWPLAPGWWVIIILVLTALFFALRFGLRTYKRNAWRRQAQKELILLKQRYLETPSSENLTRVIALMRRCAASAAQDRRILALSPSEWRNTLKATPDALNETDLDMLSTGHYLAATTQLEPMTFTRIDSWIKRLAA